MQQPYFRRGRFRFRTYAELFDRTNSLLNGESEDYVFAGLLPPEIEFICARANNIRASWLRQQNQAPPPPPLTQQVREQGPVTIIRVPQVVAHEGSGSESDATSKRSRGTKRSRDSDRQSRDSRRARPQRNNVPLVVAAPTTSVLPAPTEEILDRAQELVRTLFHATDVLGDLARAAGVPLTK
jgi:hypothetical protein